MAAEKYILVESYNGLHCLSLETGDKLWQFGPTYGSTDVRDGCTPAVDQSQGFIYYQSLGRLWKLNALNGAVLDFAAVSSQTTTISGSTILVNDGNGYYIVTVYHNNTVAYGGAIKVFDADLNLVWEATGLNLFIKNTLAYHDGVVYCGTGDLFQYEQQHEWYDGELENCRVIAYNVTNGNVLWTFNPDPEALYVPNGNKAIGQVNYCNGYIIAFSDIGCGENDQNAKMWVLDASDGSVVKSFEHTTRVGACGRAAFSYGRFFKGNLTTEATEVFQVGSGAKDDFAPFATHKTNDGVSPATALSSLDESITHIGSVTGVDRKGSQGGIIYDGKAFFCGEGTSGGVLCFDIETLDVIKEYNAGSIWDSSPMVVQNLAGEDVLLVYRKEGKKVAAFDVESGDMLWETGSDIEGYLFFGFSYYESSFINLASGFTPPAYVAGINSNLTALNALVGNAAAITAISTQVGQALLDVINTNIDNLNAELVTPVAWDDIVLGETGLSVNTKLNNFNTAFKAAV